MALKFTDTRANPYTRAKVSVMNNPLYNEKDWRTSIENGTVDAYMSLMIKSKDIDPDEFYKKYNLYYGDVNNRLTALYTEIGADRKTLRDYERPLFDENGNYMYDENGKQLFETVQMTEYDYNKENIRLANKIYGEKRLNEMTVQRRENRNEFLRFLGDIGSVTTYSGQAILQGAGNMLNLGLAGLDEAGDTLWQFLSLPFVSKGNDWDLAEHLKGSSSFAETINKWSNKGFNVGNYADQLAYNMSHFYTTDGEMTTVGKYIKGTIDTLGQMVPSMLVGYGATSVGAGMIAKAGVEGSKVGSYLTSQAGSIGQLSFYASNVFGSTVSDQYEYYASQGISVPSSEIVANALVKTALQYGVEKGLGALMGGTGLDQIFWGTSTKTNPLRFSNKNLTLRSFGRLGKDMLQEGLEESLQETSDWFVDAAHHFINHDFQNTEWNWQNIWDAFAIACLTSIVGTSGKIVGQSINRKIKTGSAGLNTGIFKTDVEGKLVKDADGNYEFVTVNPIAAYEYGLDVLSYMENIENLKKANAQLLQLRNDENTKALEKAESQYLAAYYQALGSFEILSDLYGELGAERFAKANEILTKMQEAQDSGSLNKEYRAKAQKEIIDAIPSLRNSQFVKYAESKLKDAEITKTDKSIKSNDAVESDDIISEKAKKLLDELKSVNEIILTKDGKMPVQLGNVMLIPENLLNTGNEKVVIANLAEQELADELAEGVMTKSKYFLNEVAIVTDLYRQWIGDENATEKEAIYQLIFNTSFFETVLALNERETSSYVLRLNKLVDVVGKKQDLKNSLLNKRIAECKERWTTAAFDFYSNNLDKDTSLFTKSLSSEERKNFDDRLKKLYAVYNMGKSIIDNPNHVSDVVWEFIDRRIDGLNVDKSKKDSLKLDIRNNEVKKRNTALNFINEQYNGMFNTLYNGKIYMPQNSIGNCAFNDWLKSINHTIKTIFNDDYLTQKELEELGSNYSLDDVVAYRALQFQKFYPAMDFALVNNNVVISVNGEENGFSAFKDFYNKNYVDINNGTGNINRVIATNFKSISNFIKAYLNKSLVDDYAYDFLTIDEVINHWEYLNTAVREDILNEYGQLNKDTVFRYMQREMTNETNGKKSLLFRQDGTIVVGDMTSMLEVAKTVKYPKSGTYSINQFIKSKYLTGTLSNVKVTFVNSGNTRYVDYTYDGNVFKFVNTIFINLNDYQSDAQIRFALVHEFQHAIQSDNKINLGTSSKILKYFNDKDKKDIIETVKGLEPELFNGITDKNQIKTIVEQYIYYGSGELQAYGLGAYGETAFYPVIISRKNGKTTITFKNGKSFTIAAVTTPVRQVENIVDQSREIINKFYVKYDVKKETSQYKLLKLLSRQRELVRKKPIDRTIEENIECLYTFMKPEMSLDDFKKSQLLGVEFNGDYYALDNHSNLESLLKHLIRDDSRESETNIRLFTFTPKDLRNYRQLQGIEIGSGRISLINNSRMSNVRSVRIDLNKNAEIISEQNFNSENDLIPVFNELFDDADFYEQFNADEKEMDFSGYDTLEYNGKPFWIAAVNENTGAIEQTWTYKEAEALDFDLDRNANQIFFTTDLLENGKVVYDDFGNKLNDELAVRINAELKSNDLLFTALKFIAEMHSDTHLNSPSQELAKSNDAKTIAQTLEEIAQRHEVLTKDDTSKTIKAENKIVDNRPKSERRKKFIYDSKKYDKSISPLGESKNATKIIGPKDIDADVASSGIQLPYHKRGTDYVYRKFVERRYYTKTDGTQGVKDIFEYYNVKGERRHTLKSEIEDSNLKYFTTEKGKSQITMSPKLREFIIASTDMDLDPVIMKKIKNGTLKSDDLLHYVMETPIDKSDNTTFKLILEEFYGNHYIKSAKQLQQIAFTDGHKMAALYFTLKDTNFEEFLYENLFGDRLDKIWEFFIKQPQFAEKLNKLFTASSTGLSVGLRTFNFENLTNYKPLDANVLSKELVYKTVLYYNGDIASGSRAIVKARKAAFKDGLTVGEGYQASRFGERSKYSLNAGLKEGAKTTFLDQTKTIDDSPESDDVFTDYDDSMLFELLDVKSGIGQKAYTALAKKAYEESGDLTFTQGRIDDYLSNLHNLSEGQIVTLYHNMINSLDEESLVKLYFLAELPGFEDVIIEDAYTKEQNVKSVLNKVVNYGSKIGGIKRKLNNIKKYVKTPIERNLVFSENSDILDKDLNLRVDAYKEKIGYKPIETINEISNRISQISKAARAGVYTDRTRYNIYIKQLKTNAKQIDKLINLVSSERKAGIKIVNISGEDGDVKFKSKSEMPNTIKKILETGFTRSGRSKIQELSSYHQRYNEDGSVDKVYDDKYLKMTMTHLLTENSQILNDMSEDEAKEILEFYVQDSIIMSDVDSQIAAETVRLTCAYILGESRNSQERYGEGFERFNFDETLVKKVEAKMSDQAHLSATMLSNQRTIIRLLQPNKIIAQEIAKNLGFKLDDIDRQNLDNMLDAMRVGSKESYRKAKKKFEEKIIHDYDEKSKQSAIDKLLTFERAMMLSNPGTWIRNIASNYIVEGGNVAAYKTGKTVTDLLTKMFPKLKEKLDTDEGYVLGRKVTMKSEKSKTTYANKKGKTKTKTEVNYKLTGGTISKETINFINDKFTSSGLLNEIIEGVSKYDDLSKREPVSDSIVDMTARAIHSNLRRHHVFSEEGNKFKSGGGKILNKTLDIIYKGLNDDPWVKRTTLKYFAQILEEDYDRAKNKAAAKGKNLTLENYLKTDTSNVYGLSRHVEEAFVKAVGLASYDYMKTTNFITQMERAIRENVPKSAWFMYKQVFPFLPSAWNWCVEGMRYTPLGLANAIIKLAKLENTIAKMDDARMKGKSVVNSEFAKYLQIRNVGKGTIGTLTFAIGIVLASLGWAGIDEEDDEYKLYVGDIKVNINDVLASQGVMLGIATAHNVMNDGNDVVDIFSEAFNQMFRDSIFQDFIDTFRYDTGFGDFMWTSMWDIPTQFAPNFLKTVAGIVHHRGVEYSDDPIVSKLQKLYVQNIPLPEQWVSANTKVNPYTGTAESFFSGEFFAKTFSRFLPIKVSYPSVTREEAIAIGLGINKKQLSGNYSIDGEKIKFTAKEITKLNVLYGNLNKKELTKFYNNSVKKTIKTETGYKELTYSQMNDQEKRTAIENIMSNNGSISKIYILTSTGKYKYYASNSEYEELRKLGITKNIYRKTNKNEGFVKI